MEFHIAQNVFNEFRAFVIAASCMLTSTRLTLDRVSFLPTRLPHGGTKSSTPKIIQFWRGSDSRSMSAPANPAVERAIGEIPEIYWKGLTLRVGQLDFAVIKFLFIDRK